MIPTQENKKMQNERIQKPNKYCMYFQSLEVMYNIYSHTNSSNYKGCWMVHAVIKRRASKRGCQISPTISQFSIMWRFISAVIHNTRSANMYEVHTFYFLSPSIPGAAWYGLAFSSPYVLTCYFSEKEMLNDNVHVSFSAIYQKNI